MKCELNFVWKFTFKFLLCHSFQCMKRDKRRQRRKKRSVEARMRRWNVGKSRGGRLSSFEYKRKRISLLMGREENAREEKKLLAEFTSHVTLLSCVLCWIEKIWEKEKWQHFSHINNNLKRPEKFHSFFLAFLRRFQFLVFLHTYILSALNPTKSSEIQFSKKKAKHPRINRIGWRSWRSAKLFESQEGRKEFSALIFFAFTSTDLKKFLSFLLLQENVDFYNNLQIFFSTRRFASDTSTQCDFSGGWRKKSFHWNLNTNWIRNKANGG